MSGRGKRVAARTTGAVVAVVALIGTTSLALGNPASAAPKPKAQYKAGKDTATFTLTGVLDRNCLISAGGNEIWIKPGDAIDFKSTALGIDSSKLPLLSGLNGLTSKLLSLDVNAVIGTGSSKQGVSVTGGKTTAFPAKNQEALSTGDHPISWTATHVRALGLLPISLQAKYLKSGASLSWKGVIHVTPNAPKCKLGVSTPRVDVSLGPVKVSVPQQNVSVPGVTEPNDLPSLGTLPNLPTNKPKTPAKSASPSPSKSTLDPYQLPGQTIPEQVVPGGDGGEQYVASGGSGGGGFVGLMPSNLGKSLTAGKSSSGSGGTSDSDGVVKDGSKTVDLASNPGTPSSQLPVILAILAIIALALVAGTYARLFLLTKKLD